MYSRCPSVCAYVRSRPDGGNLRPACRLVQGAVNPLSAELRKSEKHDI